MRTSPVSCRRRRDSKRGFRNGLHGPARFADGGGGSIGPLQRGHPVVPSLPDGFSDSLWRWDAAFEPGVTVTGRILLPDGVTEALVTAGLADGGLDIASVFAGGNGEFRIPDLPRVPLWIRAEFIHRERKRTVGAWASPKEEFVLDAR